MDVQRHPREPVFSILNDNDCPSFVIRQKPQQAHSPSLPQRLPSIASLTAHLPPRVERPNLSRQPKFHRNNSVSSAGSPPLLRYDSSSSTKSSDSMDSTPSPITPTSTLAHYENLLRQDPTLGYLPSPTGITPFLDQGLMIAPAPQAAFQGKSQPLAPAAYPSMPLANEMIQVPTPTLSADVSVSSGSSANQQPVTTSQPSNPPAAQKKNKYPCPYAQSHNCSATFTTSGHAARHGKKHTGEKGVHCPICNKAFTRKDNMKQHERTHKNRPSNGEEKKSKAQASREADKAKSEEQQERVDSQQTNLQPHPAQIRKSSSGQSEPSDLTLLSNTIQTPDTISPSFFPETNPQIVLPMDGAINLDASAQSLYPPIVDDALVTAALGPSEKLELPMPQPPALVRGFSDLDTLAHAAESYDPFFQPQAQF